MKVALATAVLAACYSPDARQWSDTDASTAISLTVTIMGAGKVTVVDVGTCDSATAPHGICTFAVPAEQMRELDASATKEDHPFAGWSMACTGEVATCSLAPVTSPTQVGAKFE